jgi:aspartate/methionine/tyrosine aminotransferase
VVGIVHYVRSVKGGRFYDRSYPSFARVQKWTPIADHERPMVIGLSDATLTQYERQALRMPHNLADGHARHTLHSSTKDALIELTGSIIRSKAPRVLDQEAWFVAKLRSVTDVISPAQYFVSYSASVAIDLVAKFLRQTCNITHLLMPTFDNLAALLRLNQVQTLALPESALVDANWPSNIRRGDALFLVLPNNPTGFSIEQSQLVGLLNRASEEGLILVLDMSFRLFQPHLCFDIVCHAERVGATTIVIDDTGKILPLNDSKLGVVSCTSDIAPQIRRLHRDLLLNLSTLELSLLAYLLSEKRINELGRARSLALQNQQLLAQTLGAYVIEPPYLTSVAWLNLGQHAPAVHRACETAGLEVLPGRPFFWYGNDERADQYLRVALMRDAEYFANGHEILVKSIERIIS